MVCSSRNDQAQRLTIDDQSFFLEFANEIPIDDQRSKDNIKENETATLMFLVNERNTRQLETTRDLLPEIKDVIKAIHKGEDQIGVFNLGKRKAVFLVLRDSAKALKAIEWMGKSRKLDKSGEFVKLDLN
jgi:hypothetical protein